MKIVKLQNGNVQLLSDSGELIKSLSPSATLQIAQEGAAVRVNYGKNNIHDIYPSEVTSTEIQPAAAVPFTGDLQDLFNLLSESFFFDDVSGGGGGTVGFNITSTQYGATSPFTALPSGDIANGFTFFTEADKDTDGTTTYSQLFIHNSITVTLSGTSGTANINIAGTNYLVTFNTDLATTASDWATANYATLRALSPRITPHALGTGADGRIRICSIYTNAATLDAITITNLTGDLSGTIGNEFTGTATSAGDHVMIPYEGQPFEGQRLHHTMRVNFSIQSGNIQTLDLSLRRMQNDTVVGSVIKVQRDPDVEGNQFVFETYTAKGNDPFVLGGFYFALRNDSGVNIQVGDAVGILIQTVFQSPVFFP